jgi:tripartite-type tricarboxylate transporter receptor subunit TctC
MAPTRQGRRHRIEELRTSMTPVRRALLATAASLSAFGMAGAQTSQPQRWVPDRPILFVSGYSPGGSTDIAARLLSDRMAAALGEGVRILVENRPGAAGTVATEWVKGRPADGTTIMVQEPGAGAAAPLATIGGTRYDPLNDFTHLGLISTPPEVLVVTRDFAPVGTPPHQVLAKLREALPESITYATSGFGGTLHLKSEMLARVLGARFVHVPYRSGAQMVTSIMQGDAQFGIAALASATPFLRDDRVRAVAVTGPRRFPTFPGVPTLTELGVAGFESGGWFTMIGPAGIPRPIAEALNGALVAALRDDAVRERMLLAGHDPVQGENTLETTRAFVARELEATRTMVERTGIRLQP